jgi:hypothetical protein
MLFQNSVCGISRGCNSRRKPEKPLSKFFVSSRARRARRAPPNPSGSLKGHEGTILPPPRRTIRSARRRHRISPPRLKRSFQALSMRFAPTPRFWGIACGGGIKVEAVGDRNSMRIAVDARSGACIDAPTVTGIKLSATPPDLRNRIHFRGSRASYTSLASLVSQWISSRMTRNVTSSRYARRASWSCRNSGHNTDFENPRRTRSMSVLYRWRRYR